MMTTLKITVGRGDQLEAETIERIRAAEAGEPLADDQPVLNFDNYATLARFLTDRNLELLAAISREEPGSIRAAAELVDRDYREVHRNLTALEDLGLIAFEGGEPGKAKMPVIEYDAIQVAIPLASNEEPAAAA
jgi:predicted transcriptional regulator